MYSELHSGNLILGIESFRITIINKYQWPSGSTSEFNSGGSRLFPRRGEYIFSL